MSNIGFLGLGKMGAVMAPRLLEAGHDLTVWSRTEKKSRTLVANGARLAANPAEVSASAEIIVTMLADDAAVMDVFSSPGGLLSSSVGNKLFIDMSTLRPSTVLTLAQQVNSANARFIDAPVSGTVGPAKAGQLLVLCGADEVDFRRAQDILRIFSRRIIHAGPVGCGALLKLVVNLPLAVYWSALAEAVALGKQGGLDLSLILETIQDSPAAPPVLSMKEPIIKGLTEDVAFSIDNMIKDIRSMLETGAELDLPLHTTQSVLELYSAASEHGFGEADAVEVVGYLADSMINSK